MNHYKNSKNYKILKSLIWHEFEIDMECKSYRGKIHQYHDVLRNLLISMYEDFFIEKYFSSYGDIEIRKITGIVVRSLGLRFALDDPEEDDCEKYFFGGDKILDSKNNYESR